MGIVGHKHFIKRKKITSPVVAGSCALAAILGLITYSLSTPALPSASAASPDFQVGNRNSIAVGGASDARFSARLLEMPSNQHATVGRLYPTPKLDPIDVSWTQSGELRLGNIPRAKSLLAGKVTGITRDNNLVQLTIDPRIQAIAEQVVAATKAPHVAVVAMDPNTGRILAMADRSSSVSNLATHAGFPAASLFKLVTTAATLENSNVGPYDRVAFRGGSYTLNYSNYLPSARYDRQSMTLAEALGKSCNPVFARVALQRLSTGLIGEYAAKFGFNSSLQFEYPLSLSSAFIPNEKYGLSRTAAGFGQVTLSPIHAAALAAGIANGGLLPRPRLIDQVLNPEGAVLYQSHAQALTRMMSTDTAHTILKMMEATTTTGTSAKEFNRNHRAALPGITVAAKTGTLRGKSPMGLNNWFVAAAPSTKPEIALAVIVVNPETTSSRASGIGRRFLQQYFN